MFSKVEVKLTYYVAGMNPVDGAGIRYKSNKPHGDPIGDRSSHEYFGSIH